MLLDGLHEKKAFLRQRESSWDRTGGNHDSISLGAGETHAVPELAGPGVIRHLWLTVGGGGPDTYRSLALQLEFDDAPEPQADLPVADFFLFGHGELVDVNSGPIQVSRQPHIAEKPYRGGLNCVFPMPFARRARIRFRNRGTDRLTLYYYVDWEQHKRLPQPVLPFHATLREEATRPPADHPRQEHGLFDNDLRNAGTQDNYVFLDVRGHEGHYVGTGLSIACRPGGAGKWWEGDDMFAIDGEPWPPRLHGTGTEDYFNLAWGFRKPDCRPEYGITFLDKGEADKNQIDGRFSMYRFHLNDPIPFETALLASIEHGHANDCEASYRSVAYWYGRSLA